MFTWPKGGPIRRSNFRKLTLWRKVVADLRLDGVTFHLLRHTGNTLAARSRVSTRDLMARTGHDSVRAAIIFQHATSEADARIALALGLGRVVPRRLRRPQLDRQIWWQSGSDPGGRITPC